MTRWGHRAHNNICTMVPCLVLPLLHRSLAYPTQRKVLRVTSMSNRKLWSCRSLIFKELDVKNVLMWFMLLEKSDFNSMKFSRESRGYFPGFNSREKFRFPGISRPGNSREAILVCMCACVCVCVYYTSKVFKIPDFHQGIWYLGWKYIIPLYIRYV